MAVSVRTNPDLLARKLFIMVTLGALTFIAAVLLMHT